MGISPGLVGGVLVLTGIVTGSLLICLSNSSTVRAPAGIAGEAVK